jgi:hypothetical protein
MKKQYFTSLFALLLFCFIISLVGCNKEPDIPLQGTVPVKMRCEIYGQDWQAGNHGASYINNILTIAGQSWDGTLIKIKVRMPIATGLVAGTYPIDSTFKLTSAEGIMMPGNSSVYYNTHTLWGGYLKLNYNNTVDKEISGQFAFELRDSVTGNYTRVERGIFTMKYVTSIEPIVNVFNATINGAPWTNTQNGANLILIPPINPTQLQFTAFNGNDNKQFTFKTPVNLIPGTYSLGNSLATFQAQYADGVGNILYPTASDVLTITSHDLIAKRIKGVFQMTAHDTSNVTQDVNIWNGNFDMQYQ